MHILFEAELISFMQLKNSLATLLVTSYQPRKKDTQNSFTMNIGVGVEKGKHIKCVQCFAYILVPLPPVHSAMEKWTENSLSSSLGQLSAAFCGVAKIFYLTSLWGFSRPYREI
mmetsp:Transcript_15298/g.32375  ORF Transcript_15298/g.32375 Transcript_15298/m.32375 type:complete len:114 (-) Transcript_15298:1913-2254(-)